ncbi:MAG: hypothetical protein HQL24_07330 [Candidatus Omnitrophica bacterium]|nr:hypothetical protein [Candidatus Omnitrophota bacterium]
MFKRFAMMALLLAFLTASTAAFADNVYVTAKGNKYHKADCRLIKNKQTVEMDKQKAIQQGYKPCKKCSKDEVQPENK